MQASQAVTPFGSFSSNSSRHTEPSSACSLAPPFLYQVRAAAALIAHPVHSPTRTAAAAGETHNRLTVLGKRHDKVNFTE